MTSELAERLTEVDVRQRAGIETTPRTRLIGEVIADLEPQIIKALPTKRNAERFLRLALTEIRTVPHLFECSQASVVAGVMRAAQLGLDIGGDRGQVWLIPRWNKDLRGYEATFQLGYRGIIDIAGRSGVKVSVREVHENDTFEHEDGLTEVLRHSWDLGADRGPVIGLWAKARFLDGSEPQIEVMSLAEVDQIGEQFGPRNKSGKLVGPWADPKSKPGMRRKTVLRRVLNYVPLAVEAEDALRADDSAPIEVHNTADDRADLAPSNGQAIEAPDDDQDVIDVAVTDVARHVEDLERDLDQQAAVDRSAGSETAGWSAAAEAVTTEPAADPIAQAHIDAMHTVSRDGLAEYVDPADSELPDEPDETVQQHAGRLITTLPEHRYDAWSAYVRRTGISVNPDRWSDDQAAGVLEWVEHPEEQS